MKISNAAVAAALVLGGCGGGGQPPGPVASVTVSPGQAALAVGATLQLTATLVDSAGHSLTGRDVTWSSSNPAIASVSASGLASGLVEGAVTITATSEGKSGIAAIAVGRPVASVTLDPAAPTVQVGKTVQLTAILKDATGAVLSGRPVAWSSANLAVAQVGETTGLVTAVAVGGPVTITATSEGKSGTASVTVSPVPVASVTVAPASKTIVVGQTATLTATLRDAAGNILTGRAVTWSSNSAVASVSASGIVTGASSGGTATITATSEGKTGTASIGVAGFSLTEIEAGIFHTCALTAWGAAFCWGSNDAGQLGDGTTTARSRPVQVLGEHEFTQIVAKSQAACGRTSDGLAWCWGYNGYGQLGDGTTVSRTVPVPVAQGSIRFTELAAGDLYTCGRTGGTAGGAVYCWGRNNVGQLGMGDTSDRLVPHDAISGGVPFTTIAAGGGIDGTTGASMAAACGIDSAGYTNCWGDNVHGDVGDGTTTQRTSPTRQFQIFTALAGSLGGHLCALAFSDTAYCWGWNYAGQVGDGTTTERHSPVPVVGGFKFRSLSAGGSHVCGIVKGTGPLLDGNSAYCWGRNNTGAVGDTTTTDRSSPTAVVGLPAANGIDFIDAVTAGVRHSCAISEIDANRQFTFGAYCWGDNSSGALGDGNPTATPVTSPVAVLHP